MKRTTTFLALCFSIWGSTGALAQQPEEPSGLDQEARAIFQAGQLAFGNGRFEVALTRFREAYELSQRHVLLFNIGTAADRLRQDRDALEAFQRYLQEIPDAPNRAEVQARIEVLERAVASQTPSEPAPPEEPPDEPPVEEPPQEQQPPPSDWDTSGDQPPPADDGGGGGGLFWTWIAAGTGVALLIVTALQWGAAQDEYDTLFKECDDGRHCTDAFIDEEIQLRGIEGMETRTNVFLGLGLVSLAAAGVLFFLENSGGGEEPPAATARVGVGPGSLVVQGTF